MRCITGAKFTMKATLLHVDENYTDPTTDPNVGQWVESQDPLTGEIVEKWVPGPVVDDPATPVNETRVGDFDCVVRSMGRINSSAETFGKEYENIDSVRMWLPANIRISKRDRITNIRKGNETLWVNDDGTPTTFNVQGVTPLFNGPFNQHNETYVVLERTEF